MFFFYVLRSERNGKYYTGHAEDLKVRLVKHNSGAVPSTRSGRPWRLVYHESFEMRADAMKRESEIKRKKKRSYIEQLIPR